MKQGCIGLALALALGLHESYGASNFDIPSFGECASDADVIIGANSGILDIRIKKTEDEYESYSLNRLINSGTNSANTDIRVTNLSYNDRNEPTQVEISIFDSIKFVCILETGDFFDNWRIILYDTRYNGKIGFDCSRVDVGGNVAVKDLVVHSSDNYFSNRGNLLTKHCRILSEYIENRGKIKSCPNPVSLALSGADLSNSSLLNIIRKADSDYRIYQSSENKRLGFFNVDCGTIEANGDNDSVETKGLKEVNLSGYVKVNKWISDTSIRIGSPLENPEAPLRYNCTFNYLYAPWISVDTIKINHSFQGGLRSAEGRLSIKYPDQNTKVFAMSNALSKLHADSESYFDTNNESFIKATCKNSFVNWLKLVEPNIESQAYNDQTDTSRKTILKKWLKSIGSITKNQNELANQCSEQQVNIINGRNNTAPIRIVTIGDNRYFYDQNGARCRDSEMMRQILIKTIYKVHRKPFEDMTYGIAEELTAMSYKDLEDLFRSQLIIDKKLIHQEVNEMILKAKENFDRVRKILGDNLVSNVVLGGFNISNNEIKKLNDFQEQHMDLIQDLANFFTSAGYYKEGESISSYDLLCKCYWELRSISRPVHVKPVPVFKFPSYNNYDSSDSDSSDDEIWGFNAEATKRLRELIEKNAINYAVFCRYAQF